MPVILPSPPRRASLKAFWITMSLWGGLAAGLLAPLGLGGRVVVAVLGSALVAIAGLWRPTEVAVFYRVWNKAARGYALVARTVLLALCYGLVFTAVGTAGSALRLRRPRPGESFWYPRSTLTREAYGSLHERPGPARSGRLWVALPAWALRTDNAWAVFLVPFLMLVSALDRGEQKSFPTGVYTLF